MKAPFEWIKEFVDIRRSAKDLAEQLTMTGTEISALEFHGKGVEGVIVGKIKSVVPHDKHPDMVVCQVDIGVKLIQIVTDSKSLQAGDKVPVALEGATLSKGFRVEQRQMHGVESFGMLCRSHDLGREFSEEVLKLPLEVSVGKDVRKEIGLGDYVFNVEILPNRGDCLSIIGVAREISAIADKPLNVPKIKVVEKPVSVSKAASVEVRAKDLCPRYMARVVENVEIKPSPEWLQNRLKLVGIRPINNVVDITNYLLIETGQPMHAFDLDLLSGKKIIVRKADKKENITTLDGQKHELFGDELLICDSEKAIALAGVMGGANTEVNQKTTNVLLESAFFNPASINRTSKRHKLRTESSIRFERGVDWNMVEYALDKAALMLADLAGGKVLKGKIDKAVSGFKPKRILLSEEETNRILGTKITLAETKKILKKLGFDIKREDKRSGILTVDVPGFRAFDVTREIDLIEEVARIYGYKHIPAKLPSITLDQHPKNNDKRIDELKEVLFGLGLDEVNTYSMVSLADLSKLAKTDEAELVFLLNPLSQDQSVMRTSLLPSLFNVACHNQRHQENDISIFEIGKAFAKNSKQAVVEKLLLSGSVSGKLWTSNLGLQKDLKIDFFYVKGLIEQLLKKLGIKEYKITSFENSFLQPGQSAKIEIQGRPVGVLGAVHPKVLKSFDVVGDIFCFEIDLGYLLGLVPALVRFVPLPKFPAVIRDIAMLAPLSTTHLQIVSLIKDVGGELVEQVSLFDRYSGKPIPEGKVNLAYRIIYRDRQKTLVDEQINKLHQDISIKLENDLKVQVRR